jgi:hypothetical protein
MQPQGGKMHHGSQARADTQATTHACLAFGGPGWALYKEPNAPYIFSQEGRKRRCGWRTRAKKINNEVLHN